MVVEDAINKLGIHIPWAKFIDMDKETMIGTQSITPS